MSDEFNLSTPVPHIGFLTPTATAPSASSAESTQFYQTQMSTLSSVPAPIAPVRTAVIIPSASIPLGDPSHPTPASSVATQPTQHGGGGKGPSQFALYQAQAKAEKDKEDKDRKAAKAKLDAAAKSKSKKRRASEEEEEEKSDDDGGVDAGSDHEPDEASEEGEGDDDEEEEEEEEEEKPKSKKRKSSSSNKKVKSGKKAKHAVDEQDDEDRGDDEVDGSPTSSPSSSSASSVMTAAAADNDAGADADADVGGDDVGAFDVNDNEALNRVFLIDGLKKLPLPPVTKPQDELLGQGDDCTGQSLDPLRILDNLCKRSVKQILLAVAHDRPLKLQIEKIVAVYGAPLFSRIGERLPRDESATTILPILIHLLQVCSKSDIDLITPHVHPVVMARVRLLQVAAAKKAIAAPAKSKTGGGRGRKAKVTADTPATADKTVKDSETTTPTASTITTPTADSTPPTSVVEVPVAIVATVVAAPVTEAKEGKTEVAPVVESKIEAASVAMDEEEDKDKADAVEPKYGYGLACFWMQLERFILDALKKDLNAEIVEHRRLIAAAKAKNNTSSAVNIVKEDKKLAEATLKEVRKRFTAVADMITAFKDKIKAAEAAVEAAAILSGKPKAVPKAKSAGGRGRRKKAA